MGKIISIILGIVFVLVGVLGFIDSGLVGATAATFSTNMLHDIVHFAVGIIFLIVAFAAPAKAGITMKVFGIIYLILGILGLVAANFLASILASNNNDTWLHLVLGIVIFALGMWVCSPKSNSMGTGSGQSM